MTSPFHSKWWLQGNAVVSAPTKNDAWLRVAEICHRMAEGSSQPGMFYSGGMTMQQNGEHLVTPVPMTEAILHRMAVMYHQKVMEQGAELALEELANPVYSMMIGFAIAHDLSIKDARKLAQFLYRGEVSDDQEARG